MLNKTSRDVSGYLQKYLFFLIIQGVSFLKITSWICPLKEFLGAIS